ncbi:MAG: hypothetical protein IJE92_04195, partial [Clostridia bacterium]|nr:hypothetical protein [Clostridia bacterium]
SRKVRTNIIVANVKPTKKTDSFLQITPEKHTTYSKDAMVKTHHVPSKKYKYGAKASKELQQFFILNYKSTFAQQAQICIKKKSNQTDCSFLFLVILFIFRCS